MKARDDGFGATAPGAAEVAVFDVAAGTSMRRVATEGATRRTVSACFAVRRRKGCRKGADEGAGLAGIEESRVGKGAVNKPKSTEPRPNAASGAVVAAADAQPRAENATASEDPNRNWGGSPVERCEVVPLPTSPGKGPKKSQ